MSIKVIGAGFGRTGTLSLKYALEKLGLEKCYHMLEVHMQPGHVQIWRDLEKGVQPDWQALFEGYQATVDWPSCNFWREQLQVYPEAKVLLSWREPDKWYASVMSTIWPASQANAKRDDADARAGSSLAYELIWDGIFQGRMQDKDWVISQYDAHNQAVIDEVPADKLLVYEPGQGWGPLCEFLDVPVPEEAYPNVNSTAEFKERWEMIDAQARDKTT